MKKEIKNLKKNKEKDEIIEIEEIQQFESTKAQKERDQTKLSFYSNLSLFLEWRGFTFQKPANCIFSI